MDTIWLEAVEDGDLAMVHHLLRDGADVDARDRHGQTALMVASHRGHAEVVAALIGNGADLNVTAKYGLSGLMLAVIGGHEDVVRLLVRSGADRSLQGSGAPGFHGKTAYDLGLARGMSADILHDLMP